jgi:hypothetical protein
MNRLRLRIRLNCRKTKESHTMPIAITTVDQYLIEHKRDITGKVWLWENISNNEICGALFGLPNIQQYNL